MRMYYTIKRDSKGIRVSLRKKNYKSPYQKPHSDEVGYIHVLFEPNKLASVLNVEVDPKWKNKGWGKKLYLKAIEELKKKGYKGLISEEEARTPSASRVVESLRRMDLGDFIILGDET